MVKDYLYISNYEQLFRSGVDYMRRVEVLNYGLPWHSLEEGEEGDVEVYEVTSFSVENDEERLEYKRWCDEQDARRERESQARRKSRAMIRKIGRLILADDYRKYYWAPSYMHGKLLIILIGSGVRDIYRSIALRLSAFLVASAFTFVFRCSH